MSCQDTAHRQTRLRLRLRHAERIASGVHAVR